MLLAPSHPRCRSLSLSPLCPCSCLLTAMPPSCGRDRGIAGPEAFKNDKTAWRSVAFLSLSLSSPFLVLLLILQIRLCAARSPRFCARGPCSTRPRNYGHTTRGEEGVTTTDLTPRSQCPSHAPLPYFLVLLASHVMYPCYPTLTTSLE